MKNLQQGENISLSQVGISDTTIFSGISWVTTDGQQLDIDVSAFLLNSDGKVSGDGDFIFYNQKEDSSKSISLDTEPDNGDDVQLFIIKTNKLPTHVSKIIFVATIDKAAERSQNFSCVSELCIRIFEQNAFDEKTIFFKPSQLSAETSIALGELYFHQSDLKFKALGQGFESGLSMLAQSYGIDLHNDDQSDEKQNQLNFDNNDRIIDQAMIENEIRINKKIKENLPDIKKAVQQKLNESNTRMILDRVFMDILGYKMDEVQAEVKIQGRRADYVLSINDNEVIVVEAKKAGMTLKDEQIFQATSYGAYSGIKYVLLTNLSEFVLFKIKTDGVVEYDAIFSVDLLGDIGINDIKNLALISRYGMTKVELLDTLCDQVIATDPSNIGRLLLTGEIIDKLKEIINRDQNLDVTQEQIQETLELILGVSCGDFV